MVLYDNRVAQILQIYEMKSGQIFLRLIIFLLCI